jgi:hypothetical protein
VKELILSGEFDLLICPKCEEMVQHEEPFLYIDPTRDILAFVMPESYEAERDKWIARMQADYEPVKAALNSGQGLTGEPLYLFGLGALTALLESDRDREEETDVMEFIAREEGLHLLPVKPAAARELDLLFSIPVQAGMAGRAAALTAAERLYAKNDALPRLKKLVDFLKTPGSDTVPFLKTK